MQPVPSTFIALIAFAVILRLGPWRGLLVLFAMMPFGSAAAINFPAVGNVSLSVEDVAIVAIWCLIFTRPLLFREVLGTARLGQPGLALLIALVIAILGCYFLPRVFAGHTETFSIARNDTGKTILVPLVPNMGNLSQLFRMILATSAFFALAATSKSAPQPRDVVLALSVATVLNLVVSFLDAATYYTGTGFLLEPIRTMNYQILDEQKLAGGIRRLIGGYPEPSAFGYFSIGLFAFWLRYWFGNRQSRVPGFFLGGTLLVILLSTSSSTIATLAVFVPLFAVAQAAKISSNERILRIYGFSMATLPVVLGCMMLIYSLIPAVPTLLDSILLDKMDSSSGVERMSWNTQAFQNFTDTWLLGAGLGSVRGSSWLAASLGSLGLPGTVAFLVFCAMVFRLKPVVTGLPDGHGETSALVVSALKTACFAVFLQSMTANAVPNFGTHFFAMAGLAAGLTRATELGAQRRRRTVAQAAAAPLASRPVAAPDYGRPVFVSTRGTT